MLAGVVSYWRIRPHGRPRPGLRDAARAGTPSLQARAWAGRRAPRGIQQIVCGEETGELQWSLSNLKQGIVQAGGRPAGIAVRWAGRNRACSRSPATRRLAPAAE